MTEHDEKVEKLLELLHGSPTTAFVYGPDHTMLCQSRNITIKIKVLTTVSQLALTNPETGESSDIQMTMDQQNRLHAIVRRVYHEKEEGLLDLLLEE